LGCFGVSGGFEHSAYSAAKRIDELFPAGNRHATNGTSGQLAGATNASRESEVADAASASGRNKPLAFTLKDVNPSHPMIQERGISTCRR
jgi:hypothetical protein